ncbi:amino acid adenylation domain-containing protein [Micromonospora sp. WMMA1363]|uniref:non-ribosomal peptide synthetase n=1 Tax=Micromonospora sp. WMMA1363 TaxID=3053985 RepID=UPI00259C9D0C|nr:non-ribosomal peptide synthetase [Micromonospora sp. WMMA1363]MDM4718648.1 amino acid adenylation domain-containing protein [Micromonospora sp. WMMA1363]
MRQDIAAVLGEPPDTVADDADLLQLGLDSIGVMRLVGQWHQRGVPVGFAELIEGRTLDDWWQMVAERAPDPGGPEAENVAVVDDDAPFDLAPMQHAYWVGRGDGQALGGVGAHFYNEFDGRDVDPTRLQDAVRALMRRHDMLRARFDDDGQQHILVESPWTGLTVHDLRGYDADSAERYLLGLRDRMSHRRLDVARGEVFDVQLSLLPDGGTRCHVHIEMLVADAHSFRILMSDLARLYRDPEAALPAIGITYPSYLATLHQRRRAERERDQEHWRSRLPELPGPPELPLAVDPRQVSGQRVVRHHHWVEPAQVERLSQRARSYGLTLPVLFLAAFGHVLGRWSVTERFLLNLPLYDRQPVHPDVAHLVGDFTNLLLLEVDTAAGDSFVDFARAVQDRMRTDAAHPGYTGVDVLRDLTRRRGEEPVGAPVVFTSALSLGELFDGPVRQSFGTPGWTMSQTPQVWLDVQVTEREHGLFLNWDVADELFPPGLVGQMFQAYLTMLGWLLDDADWTGDPPDLLSARTREVRATVNDTARAVRPRRLHEDVFSRAAAEPDRAALLWDTDGLLSYGELAEWADRVAAALVGHGVRRGDPVAVTVERGPRQVVAVLAVLRAGGVYVPVGVDQPTARRNRIHAVAGVRHVVAAVPPPGLPADICVVDVADLSTPPVAPVAGSEDDLAYLLFTSGSTGEPKGVQVPHRAAVNTIDDINRRFQVGAADRVLAVSSLDFDLSVYDIFALLSVGGAVVCVGDEDRRDAQRWRELVLRHRVTVWQSVPALLDMLLSAEAPADRTRLPLRLALLGGDWVGLDLAGRLTEQAPAATLVALGGTTETAIHSTVQVVPVPTPPAWRSVPYGLPLANQRMRVVDPAGRDRPDWVTGELWIGGRSVAHGYRGDPERTARQFVELDGVRWYRTGDLARCHPDGTVEFLGRADAQVKIRGHRVELGEIEAALERHPDVRRAVVVALGTPRRLAAAVTVTADVDPPDLRDFLAGQVPGYMVPEQVVPTDQLPLSANAKIDRRAVARIVEAARAEPEALEEPVGDIEREVARIWAELLGVPAVGRRQTFFAAGGDSLVAIRSMSLLATAGLVGADLRQLFATPALCDFAATLRRGRPDRPAPAALRPDPARRHDPFPPTDVQRAYWLGRSSDFALGGVGSHWYWEFDGADVDLDRLETAVNTLVRRHDMLRAIFDEDGDQRVLPEVGRFRIEVRDGGDEALSGLREKLAHRIPDPGRWPLLEIGGVRYGDGRVRIGFSFDYIVLDALSIVIFFDELTTLYRDPTAELRPVGVGFRDYVLAAPAEETVAADQRYWLDRLDDLPPAPPLPLAVDPATVVAPRFRRREDRLDPQQWRRLTERARRYGVTPASVLAAAYAEVLSAWSGRTELTVNFTLFNRRDVHPDIGHILGDFTSLLLVGYRAGAGERWLDVVRRMQEQVWEGMAHDTVSALWVLRELARREQGGAVSMPVVFTSALGVAGGMSEMSFPFGELVWGISQTPQVWLDNQVMERDGGLTYNWDSVEELFPAGLLDAMFDAYRDLLRWLSTAEWDTAGPPLLPAAQRQTRAEANDTAGPMPDGLLHTGFFTRAAEAPEAVAVVTADGTEICYGDLADRALRLAGALRDHGVRPGDAVAVTLPRGVDQLAAVLGALAAGALYVPVGVDQPADRRGRIYARADARVVIAEADPGTTRPLLAPDTSAPPLPAPVAVDPDRLAYAIFTSGSTGEPKGVEITHRAALNTVDDINRRYDVGPADRVLAVSSLDFDLSVYDIFGLLTAGGAVVLIADEDRREARSWAVQAREAGVTLWNSVPALLDMLLVAADADGLPPGLRLVLLSGDWVGLDLPGRLRRHQPQARFVALGGATEAAIWSNACEVGEVPAHWRSVPYGRPLRNQRYRVVDPRGRDCPDWVAGELWIGGAGVAHGYRGDPETTARQFVNADGGRWYRTGDLGCYWPDGTLEFLGRVDFQVKIRGHRIELGEIEAAAEANPAVARAVALTVGEGRHRRLALAVVPAAGAAVDTTELVGLLAERVPSYMVPEQVHEVSALPLTANGKVDRRALTAHLGPDVDEEREEPPRGDSEKLIAEIWAEVLDCDRVGRQQSFFALGGDSLLATRLVELLRRRHGVELSLRQLFLAPTVAQLADVFDAHRAAVESGDFEEGIL